MSLILRKMADRRRQDVLRQNALSVAGVIYKNKSPYRAKYGAFMGIPASIGLRQNRGAKKARGLDGIERKGSEKYLLK